MPFNFSVFPSTVIVSGILTPATSPARADAGRKAIVAAAVTAARMEAPGRMRLFMVLLPEFSRILSFRRRAGQRELHDLADQLRVGAPGLARGHHELRSAREPRV